MKIIVVGGGWSGCAAALAAVKAGAEVHLYERTDMLLGLGNVGGIMRNNGRFTASEELLAMGGGDLIKLTDEHSVHRNIEFPGHEHARCIVLRHFPMNWKGINYFFLSPPISKTSIFISPV